MCATGAHLLADTARLLISSRPFRLYSSGGARVTSNEPYAIATCCSRSNSQPYWQFRCARIPQRRAVQRSYDNQEVARQPLFATATGQASLPAVHPERLAPSLLVPLLRLPWSLPGGPPGGSSCAVASGRHSLTSCATRSKRLTRRETCQSCETTARTLPGSGLPRMPYFRSSAGRANTHAVCAGHRGRERPLHRPAWRAQLLLLQ